MVEVPVDRLLLDADQKEDVQKLAALGYDIKEIALSLGLDSNERQKFLMDADTNGTDVNILIREGILVSRSAPELKLHAAAETGNIDAIKTLAECQKRHVFENLIKDMDDAEFEFDGSTV